MSLVLLARKQNSVWFAAFWFAAALSFFAILSQAQDDPDRSAEAITLFNKGQDAHEKGDLAAAIDSYERSLKIIPEFPEAELQRGNAYLSIGKLDESIVAFRRAAELRADWSLALANLGAALVRKGSYPEAEKHLAKAIELDELNFPAYVAMTELRLQTKADAKTLKELRTRVEYLTTKANPTASIWASRAALEIASGDRKSARISAARAVELDPKSQFALATSADLSLLDNDPAAAEVFIKRLETVGPDTESTKQFRARLLVAQGKIEDAISLMKSISNPNIGSIELTNQLVASITTKPAELEQQLVSDPRNVVTLAKLCSALRIADPVKALDYCRRAAEAAPGDVQPVIGYGAALVQAKRYEDAVLLFRKLLVTVPDNSTARANLATALFQLKRYQEAKVEFRWLTEKQPDQAIAYYFLGIIHDNLMEFGDAAANYQQFLRVANPESSKLEIERVNLRLPVLYNLLKEGKGKKRG